MKPLLPNTYVLNNKYLQSIISPSTDIIDYNFSSDQIHKLNLLQILRPDIYFNKKLSDNEFFDLSKKYYQRLIDEKIIYKSENETGQSIERTLPVLSSIFCVYSSSR